MRLVLAVFVALTACKSGERPPDPPPPPRDPLTVTGTWDDTGSPVLVVDTVPDVKVIVTLPEDAEQREGREQTMGIGAIKEFPVDAKGHAEIPISWQTGFPLTFVVHTTGRAKWTTVTIDPPFALTEGSPSATFCVARDCSFGLSTEGGLHLAWRNLPAGWTVEVDGQAAPAGAADRFALDDAAIWAAPIAAVTDGGTTAVKTYQLVVGDGGGRTLTRTLTLTASMVRDAVVAALTAPGARRAMTAATPSALVGGRAVVGPAKTAGELTHVAVLSYPGRVVGTCGPYEDPSGKAGRTATLDKRAQDLAVSLRSLATGEEVAAKQWKGGAPSCPRTVTLVNGVLSSGDPVGDAPNEKPALAWIAAQLR
jgi:hypothetical protein